MSTAKPRLSRATKKPTIEITYEWLVSKNACRPQLELFKELFGLRITLNKDKAKHADKFNIWWLGTHALKDKPYKVFKAYEAEYSIEYAVGHSRAYQKYTKDASSEAGVKYIRAKNKLITIYNKKIYLKMLELLLEQGGVRD